MSEKWVYQFHEGNAEQKELLGGKGAGLAEMTRVGLPVPPGFTITTAACRYYAEHQTFPPGLREQVREALMQLQQTTQKTFGEGEHPLLLSVRSGAKFSMPGMMDTVLNLGLNDATAVSLARLSDNPLFVNDTYRRFIMMFSDVVLDLGKTPFEERFHQLIGEPQNANVDNLKTLIQASKDYVASQGHVFPENPEEQLWMTIEAVFKSWNNPRAIYYRNLHQIPHNLGTAVNVQTMVFGNMGQDSATGVAFTRNPSTGEKLLYGEYLLNAQGEDVVAGIRTPHPIAQLAEELPTAFAQFEQVATQLEQHFRDVQDIEFTIEKGHLYMLQTRTGKRTPQAAVKIAVALVHEGMITPTEAVLRVDPQQLDVLLHQQLDATQPVKVLAQGLPASPGAASGQIVFEADDAQEQGKQGQKVILVRPETCPDDIHGLMQAEGVLTSRGGMTSHAAVVARQMAKPCVAGCAAAQIDLEHETLRIGEHVFHKGDWLTINGSNGDVIIGSVSMVEATLDADFYQLLTWADELSRLKVRTNADTPHDAVKARQFGAVGIGLCRTEHMFMASDRLPLMQQMILAATTEEREVALKALLPMQREDFAGLFEAMDGYPVTIRLLDPPLHEFLPNYPELLAEVTELALTKGQDSPQYQQRKLLLDRLEYLRESNPMLGLRGCRLGILFPEINRMQMRAIMEAAIQVRRQGHKIRPEVMIPLVGHVNELKVVYELLKTVADEVMAEQHETVDYQLGTMIEVPRAALTAGEIAQYAEFFSFGTNDLTQMTMGLSRDDAESKFLKVYLEQGLLQDNPFEVLDRAGVGQLVAMAVKSGRAARPDLKLGICGEHGGNPPSIGFAHEVGLDYVSCSPYRVPIARLAAAQANIRDVQG